MKRTISILLACLVAALPLARAPAMAADAPELTHPQTLDETGGATSPADDAVEAQRWWGVAGALVCGGGMLIIRKLLPAVPHPGVIAATVGGCMLALLDMVT